MESVNCDTVSTDHAVVKRKRHYKPQAQRFKGIAGLPHTLRRRIEFWPDGKEREPRRVAWFYRYLEIGDGAEAAREVGYSKDSSASTASRLKQEFAPLVLEALRYQGVADLPVARAVLLRAMRVYDPEAKVEEVRKLANGDEVRRMVPDMAKAGAAVGMMAVKAAEAYMDRLGMPRAMEIKLETGEDATKDDFRLLIDRAVAGMGLDAVRQMGWLMSNREYREYVEEKYGAVKDVTPGVGEE